MASKTVIDHIFEITNRSYSLIVKLEPSVILLTVEIRPIVFTIVDDEASEDKKGRLPLVFGNLHEVFHVDFWVNCFEDLLKLLLSVSHVDIWVLKTKCVNTWQA